MAGRIRSDYRDQREPECMEGPAVILKIVDLPKDLDKDTIHSYGPDSFKLHRFPLPVPGKVLGLVGPHSVGKTTALKVLARELKPNFGRFDDSPDWPEIWTHFHRFELQRYFQILNMNLKVVFKPQQVPDFLIGQSRVPAEVLERVTLAIALLQKANVYIFDEISNSLDVHHRFKVAQLIRSLIRPDSYVIVVDNDLSVVDYVSDYMYCLYGEPGEYGVFAKKGWHVKAGIEHYLRGFDPVEKNLIRGLLTTTITTITLSSLVDIYSYPSMIVTHTPFKLEVKGGEFDDGQILLVLGDNGTGKSTFIRMLADLLPPDQVVAVQPWRPNFLPSYKPQKNELGSECTVRLLLERKRPIAKMHSRFVSDVMKPLQIYPLLDRKVATLSPGETQRVAITLCLATNANVYLIDEPSAYLDSDMRIKAAMAIRRHHDFLMAAYLADKVILAERTPSAKFATSSPYPRVTGLDLFLKKMNMTFRRDTDTFRFTPRVNILGSAEDKDQKAAGVYYGLA
ncbi:hypothetical protein Bca52824_051135 [Brassica carinata]|uniref:ABC transporter domain-containing protein n=1 Tax=Brassica carinata TaxID=52824 RepID=A0A8X7UHG9_BRACI|nr:hypothetical protein Bca52824_051135 [Brassica carinata]